MAPGPHPAIHAWSGDPTSGEPPINDWGIALRVEGKAQFATAGEETIAEGNSSVMVAHPAATETCHIIVTLAGDPGDAAVKWVERSSGNFTVHLTTEVSQAVPFTYLIVHRT